MELVFRQRNVSSTQSSWKTIVEKLKPFGVFKEFEGNKALKNALSDFLMGIYD